MYFCKIKKFIPMNPLLNKLPIGLQTFSEIRKNDCLYMDKTEYKTQRRGRKAVFFFSTTTYP